MDPLDQPQAKQTLIVEMRTVTFSLAVGSMLVGVKLLAYYLTKSTAIFSDAMENIVNVFSAAFALYALRVAHQPADQDHPYGHGKVEFLSAGFEGGMIVLAAVLIVVRAAEALVLRQSPTELTVGLLVTGFSTVLCAVTGLLLKRRGNSSGSVALQADGVHLLSDAVTGAVVLAALIAVRWSGWGWIDSLAALGLGVWIAGQGARLMRRAAAGLMDEQDAADANLLAEILESHAGRGETGLRICSFHKVRHRHSGRHHWVDFHIQVPPQWDVDRGHRVATAIEMEIERKLGNCSATAHVEPCPQANHCPNCEKTAEKSL